MYIFYISISISGAICVCVCVCVCVCIYVCVYIYIYSGCEEWDKVMKMTFLEESHQLDEFLVGIKKL